MKKWLKFVLYNNLLTNIFVTIGLEELNLFSWVEFYVLAHLKPIFEALKVSSLIGCYISLGTLQKVPRSKKISI